MKASEIRVGNLIRLNNLVYTSDLDTPRDIFFKNGDYSAILLTEEWLLKFGFVSEKKSGFATGKQIDFKLIHKEGFLYNEIQNQWYWEKHKINALHVHQLQNLYFALTGKELKLKS